MNAAANNSNNNSDTIPLGAAALPDAEQLPDDPATLKRMVLELLATLHERDRDLQATRTRDLQATRTRLDLLIRRLYGPRQERIDPNQPLLFADLNDAETMAPEPAAEGEGEPAKPRRGKPHGRRRLPAELARQPVHHELTEAERVCVCGQVRIDIGCDTSEQLDYKPASLFVWEHHVHKYACSRCAERTLALPPGMADGPESLEEPLGPVVVSAAKPALPIDKGLPGSGLLAHLIVSKYVDHLPPYRLERIYERQGVMLPRSTTCDWLAACAQLLRPLYELMISTVLKSRIIHTDDTPIQIHDPPSDQTKHGRMWLYHGDAAHPYNVFDFTPNRKRDGPQQFLQDFQGFLQADAFSGYDGLYLPDPRDGAARIVEVACNAHARRKYYEARGTDAARSHQALAYYGQLYEIERRATADNADDAKRLRLRQDLAVPVLREFKSWLDRENAIALPRSPMAAAIGYALNQWTALVRYTEDGELAIDNNVSEREMKRIAIGRKNWLFVGSEHGGRTAAVLFSFTSTCARLGIEPWAYLQDVLTRLPRRGDNDLAALLPDRWQAARVQLPPSPPNDDSPS